MVFLIFFYFFWFLKKIKFHSKWMATCILNHSVKFWKFFFFAYFYFFSTPKKIKFHSKWVDRGILSHSLKFWNFWFFMFLFLDWDDLIGEGTLISLLSYGYHDSSSTHTFELFDCEFVTGCSMKSKTFFYFCHFLDVFLFVLFCVVPLSLCVVMLFSLWTTWLHAEWVDLPWWFVGVRIILLGEYMW